MLQLSRVVATHTKTQGSHVTTMLPIATNLSHKENSLMNVAMILAVCCIVDHSQVALHSVHTSVHRAPTTT